MRSRLTRRGLLTRATREPRDPEDVTAVRRGTLQRLSATFPDLPPPPSRAGHQAATRRQSTGIVDAPDPGLLQHLSWQGVAPQVVMNYDSVHLLAQPASRFYPTSAHAQIAVSCQPAFAIGCVIALAAGCSKETPPSQRPAPAVGVITVEPQTIPYTIDLRRTDGELAARSTSWRGSRASRQDRLSRRRSGEASGSLLFQLDPKPFQSAARGRAGRSCQSQQARSRHCRRRTSRG